MNFDDAIVAHMRWKFRLTDYIEGKSIEKLDAKVVCRDDACDLGKWIKGSPTSPELENLRQAHAVFHAQAGSVVEAFDAKRAEEGRTILEGSYLKASSAVIFLIRQMGEKAA